MMAASTLSDLFRPLRLRRGSGSDCAVETPSLMLLQSIPRGSPLHGFEGRSLRPAAACWKMTRGKKSSLFSDLDPRVFSSFL